MKTEPLKPPIELMRKGDKNEKVLAYACGTCGIVCREELARSHCATKFCDCGAEIDRKGYAACSNCISAHDAARLQARKTKAEKIPAMGYEGAVYWDEAGAFYSGLGEAIEAIEDEVEHEGIDPAAQTLWACDEMNLVLDAGAIISAELESQEHHEDAEVSQAGYDDLAEFLVGWNEKYGEHVESWWADEKRLIVVDWEGAMYHWWCDHCKRGLYHFDSECNYLMDRAIDGDGGYLLCPTCNNALGGFYGRGE